jgi:hypothetical protein
MLGSDAIYFPAFSIGFEAGKGVRPPEVPLGAEPEMKEQALFCSVQRHTVSGRKDIAMKRNMLIASAVALSVGLTSPVAAQSAGQMVKGTAIGAGGGALAGAILPGVSAGNGALIGAVGGAAYTALKKNHHYYRDNRGRKYYIDKHGYRHYK